MMLLEGLQPVYLALAFAAGLAVGWFFFYGLWWTVRRLPTSRHPALLTLGSLGLRMGVSLGVLFVVMAGDWRRLAAAVVGVVVMRLILVRRLRPAAEGS
ncbi:MAG: hypothetical protein K9K36_13965 [Desulfarculaceae bacterium]|nr:hypothetical protein [Desulfarculaceae bacterium]MCF8048654.1 hypothetical protein [Desulfarculaceae bacterium]MCF8066351.1 hypothetical protein [Desulfarculaceae bacterium]MCF8123586.1 hypothetical protein [Desulfarculaceae bacterium]